MDTEYKQSRILNGKKSSVRKNVRRFLSVGCAFLVALGLGNCQSELCKVTRSGDVNAVQKVLNSGVSAKDLNKAVEIAYKNGNKAVYDQLVKAGAAVAPDFMAGKVFVAQIDELGETEIDCNSDLAEQIMNHENFTPEASLPIVQWRRPNSDDTWSQLTSLTWKNDQKNEFRHESKATDGTVSELQSYKRVGCNRAIVYYSNSYWAHDAWSCMWAEFKYELTFETPTQGYFRGYYNSKYGSVCLFEGRFWLKDAPKK